MTLPTLAQLRDQFTAQGVGDALFQANAVTSGTKTERIGRLLDLRRAPADLLDFFSAAALHGACRTMGISSTVRKAEAIAVLLSRVQTAPTAGQQMFGAVRNWLTPSKAKAELPAQPTHAIAS